MTEQMNMDAERSAFEAWVIPGWSLEKYTDHDGDTVYVEDWVQGAWMCWQARASLPGAVPDGYALVPYHPTPEMVRAAEEAHMPCGDMDIALRMAILAAAPAVKAEQVQCEECGGDGAGGEHEDDCSKAIDAALAASTGQED